VAAFGETGGAGTAASQALGLAGTALGALLAPHAGVRLLVVPQGVPGTATLTVDQVFRPVADVYKMTRSGLRLGFIDQMLRASGGPQCTAPTLPRRGMYQLDTTTGTWAGSTYTGSWDMTFPPGSFGGHRRE
jgi:hypothetical protein